MLRVRLALLALLADDVNSIACRGLPVLSVPWALDLSYIVAAMSGQTVLAGVVRPERKPRVGEAPSSP